MADRKTEILDVASELLQTRGFSAFSYQDIADRIGITKATLHHHFPTKEALGAALAERCYSETQNALDQILRTHTIPWEQLDGYFRFATDIMKSGLKICAKGALEAEFNVISDGMRARTARIYDYVIGWLAGVLSAGRTQGVMHFPGKPEDQAALIHAAVQGGLQNARAEGTKIFPVIVRQLKQQLKGPG